MVETGTIQRDDFDGFGELFTKAIQWLAVVAVSFGPAILLLVTAGKERSESLFLGGVLIDKLDELWSAIFLSRILGGLYYVNRRKLAWFGE